MSRRLPFIVVVLFAIALRISAQEPMPAVLTSASFAGGSDGVMLTLPWRYAEGDAPGRELPAYDDSRWIPVRTALGDADLPPGGWRGVGWFRRHLLITQEIASWPLLFRITASGSARVYLDGRLIAAVGERSGVAVPAIRNDVALSRLAPGRHLLAVRYAYPPKMPGPATGIGFVVSLSRGLPGAGGTSSREWVTALRGAVIALAIFLALLHFTLFSFDRRAQENLWYALEMVAFAAIIMREYRDIFFAAASAGGGLFDRIASPLPTAAILFGALTYYALRTPVWPRAWRAFLGAAIVLYATSYFWPATAGYLWIPYFVAFVAEVFRVERSKRTIEREGIRFYLVSMAIFGMTIVLQVLVNFDVVPPVAGIREVYVLGILASAVGMSLYLANTLGLSRIREAEHRRKTLELEQARDLQLSMLPREMPEVSGLDIAATTRTAAEVGGDYYDVRPVDDRTLLLAFGDATGHGLSSGIVVTAAKALFTSLTPSEPPHELLEHCDRTMAGMRLPTLRMCLTLARVSRDEVRVASAAMPPMLIHRRATGHVEELGDGGLPLGSRLGGRFIDRVSPLAAGDTLLFASDGLAELLAADEQQFGYERVAQAFARAATASSAQQVVDALVDEAQRFRGTRPQDDDITLLVVRVMAA